VSTLAPVLSRLTGLDFVFPETTPPTRLTLQLRDATIGTLVEVISTRTGWVVDFTGSSMRFLIGEEPASIAVADVGWYAPERIAEALGQALGTDAAVRPLSAGVLVQGDESTLRRLRTVEGVLQQSRPAAWEFSMWVVALSGDTRSTVEAAFSSRGAARVDVGDPWESAISGLVQASWTIEGARSGVRSLSAGSVVVLEGEKGRWQAGERVPVPRRTVSPQGTVSVSGYDFVDVGYICDLAVQRNPDGVTVTVKPEISSIIGFVEDAPRVATRSIESVAYLRSGSYLIVSGLDEWRDESRGSMFGLGGTRAEASSRVLFILRATLLQ
jgi:hypothetical protein